MIGMKGWVNLMNIAILVSRMISRDYWEILVRIGNILLAWRKLSTCEFNI